MHRPTVLITLALLTFGCGGLSQNIIEHEPEEPAEPADEEAIAEAPPEEPEEEPAEPLSLEAPEHVAEAPDEAEVTPSGLASLLLRPGHGSSHPRAEDRVTVHYVGWTTDGQRFDSSIERGEPATFGLGQVIRGWTEGVQLMVEGERRRFWIPAELAYGENPRAGAPMGMLVFDIELIRIRR